jgi:hypothetical protein
VAASRAPRSPAPKRASDAAITAAVASGPCTVVVTSSARRFCAARRNGSAATVSSYCSISARVRKVKIFSRSTTSASSVFNQNWYIR